MATLFAAAWKSVGSLESYINTDKRTTKIMCYRHFRDIAEKFFSNFP